MGTVELRWLLAGVGLIVIALVGLWGMRTQIQERLRERRLRSARLPENEPVLADEEEELARDAARQEELGSLAAITPDHPLADQVLVDVEINPVRRGDSAFTARPAEPAAARETAEPLLTMADFKRAERAERFGPVESPAAEDRAVAETAASTAPPRPEPAVGRQEPHLEAGNLGPSPPSQMTVLLTVVAPPSRPFRGPSILLAAQELKLKLHKNGVFDYFPAGQVKGKPVFGIAHLREPGMFELESIGKLVTPGLLMFMQLPGPVRPAEALEMLLEIARQLAQKLGGSVCDEHRLRLSSQTIGKLKSQVAAFAQQLSA
jgi:cell division protein ZipA